MSLITKADSALSEIDAAGTRKVERVLITPQAATIRALSTQAEACETGPNEVINFCANNYLGLANHPQLIAAAKSALDTHGFGMASVRFICGTQDLHRQLEQRLAGFLNVQDTIVFPSCFDANGGIFEVLLDSEDAVISDSLNHASIIDGIRLCKAQRFRYANNNMAELEAQLAAAKSFKHRLIVTDGVFSMDGIVAKLPQICELADQYDAMVMVDDCHATGFMGNRGAGTPDFHGVEGRVQILSGTLGKALGGASGGYIAGPKPIIELLRQRARPYLFSNAVAPAICAASLAALDIVEQGEEARAQLNANASRFRMAMTKAGFDLVPGDHAIIPVMIGDAAKAARFADALLLKGIYVIAFSYPVVPQGKARIRTQMSAAHSFAQIDQAVEAFVSVAKEMGLISR